MPTQPHSKVEKEQTGIIWSEQHCGVRLGSYGQMLSLMPDLIELSTTFPENPNDFVWDVKVHMLMPGQFPCIPNWHFDNIPRVNGRQRHDLRRIEFPMYLWVSNEPLPEFRGSLYNGKIQEKTWFRFSQADEHRGTVSKLFCWRGFIRATHKEIAPTTGKGHDPLRRHSQVYLDANKFTW